MIFCFPYVRLGLPVGLNQKIMHTEGKCAQMGNCQRRNVHRGETHAEGNPMQRGNPRRGETYAEG